LPRGGCFVAFARLEPAQVLAEAQQVEPARHHQALGEAVKLRRRLIDRPQQFALTQRAR
jgi:hypothetical protein